MLSGSNGITYGAGGAFADTEASTGTGLPYLAQRGPDGWSSEGLAAPRNPPTSLALFLVPTDATSSDGRSSVSQTPARLLPSAPECSDLVCSPQLYLRNNVTHTFQTISRAPLPGTQPLNFLRVPIFSTATPDLSHVLFTEPAVLVPGAPEGVANLYEWTNDGSEDGDLRLVGRGLDNQPLSAGSAAGQGTVEQPTDTSHDNRRAISEDGRRVVFLSGGQLYVREDGTRTIAVSASQLATPEARQPATFVTADAAHGSTVFFISGEKLTADSKATEAEQELYRFDVGSETLNDISATDTGPGDVRGLLGASADASSLYFAANAQLISGKGIAGQPNIYLWRDDGTPNGSLTFVATLFEGSSGRDGESNWQQLGLPAQQANGEGIQSPMSQHVSSDGRYLALVSSRQLTSYDTAGQAEIYLYDSDSGAITCASCNPDAAASTSNASLREIGRFDVQRSISEDGKIAFITPEALSLADTNGQRDVYLYEGGAPNLISTGKSPELSTFLGMDPNGGNVFFATAQQLVGGDTDQLIDLYDARVGGGFLETPSPLVCDGEVCRGTAGSAASQGSPGSAEIAGAGNPRSRRDCSALARRARGLDRRATRLRQRAKKQSGNRHQAKRQRGHAARLAKQAKRLNKSTKICRRTNRGVTK